jgi:hypothetical protein
VRLIFGLHQNSKNSVAKEKKNKKQLKIVNKFFLNRRHTNRYIKTSNINSREIKIKATGSYNLLPIRMAIFKMTKVSTERCGENETLAQCLWEAN